MPHANIRFSFADIPVFVDTSPGPVICQHGSLIRTLFVEIGKHSLVASH